jgi:uncharacterized protein with HEPN domain
MSERHPKLLLEDILDSADKITRYTYSMTFDEFAADSKTIDAVIRNLEIIGEASNRLPDEVKDNNPQINWHKMRGLRNRIAHGYFGLNYKIIWEVVEGYIPELFVQIDKLIEEY